MEINEIDVVRIFEVKDKRDGRDIRALLKYYTTGGVLTVYSMEVDGVEEVMGEILEPDEIKDKWIKEEVERVMESVIEKI